MAWTLRGTIFACSWAVARAGKTLGAARALHVSQPTVVRRVAALEGVLGAPLFDRRPTGYTLTPLGREVLAAAQAVEVAAEGFGAAVSAARRPALARLRVTAPENLTGLVIAPAVRAFRARCPGVAVEVLGDDRVVDVARGDADIALRAGVRPEDPTLVARKVVTSAWAVYAAADGSAGLPDSLAALALCPLVVAEGPLADAPAFRWLAEVGSRASVAWRSPSLSHLQSAVRAGLGVSVLPCVVGEGDPALRRCFGPVSSLDAEMWLIVRGALRADPTSRVMLDCIASVIATLRSLFEGHTSAKP